MNILVIYPQPDKFKKPRFGFSYEMLTISTVLAKYHNVYIKDFSCEAFETSDFVEYVRRESIDIALIECDSYALKRSQNTIHASKIIDILNQYVTLNDEFKTEDHIFACYENRLNDFRLDDIKKRKDSFLSEYYQLHRSVIEQKIRIYGTPF